MSKLDALKDLLKTLPGAVVAYSGGVDSTLLAYVAHQVLGERALAVTAVSPTYPENELTEAKAFAEKFGLTFQIVRTNEFEDRDFLANPPDRCYYCKRELFVELKAIADAKGYVVLDGANADDLSDHRPGHRAAHELGVRSPLMEVGMTKAEIREISKELQLPTWEKPAYACLASRIPYGQTITPEKLGRIDQGEEFLASLGFRSYRLRDHDPVARLEFAKDELDKAWALREGISAKLHELGFRYVTIDLDGFRSGSMNEVL
jgi:uncharacterized protein